jgi:hypothetical protein
MFANHHGLRVRAVGNEKSHRQQWYLAHEACRKYLHREEKSPERLAQEMGILPIEFKLYVLCGNLLTTANAEFTAVNEEGEIDFSSLFSGHWKVYQEIIAKEVRLT